MKFFIDSVHCHIGTNYWAVNGLKKDRDRNIYINAQLVEKILETKWQNENDNMRIEVK